MISRENSFNFFKIQWRCRVCTLFECVLRVEEFVYEFQRYLRLKLIQRSFQILIFLNANGFVYTRKWKLRVIRVPVYFECYLSDAKILIRSLKKFKNKIFRKSKIRNKTKTETVNHTKLFSSPIQNKKTKK